MSRTFNKFTLAVALAFTAMTTAAHAQDARNNEALTTLLEQMSNNSAGSDEIASQIETRIREIMAEVGTAPTQSDSSAVTIEEIDRINRAAERERIELEFEKARNERSQLEIDRLLALYEAIKAIEEDKQQENTILQAHVKTLVDSDDDKQEKVDKVADAISNDQKNLPRIEAISGVGGVYTADAEFNDTFVTLRVGENTLNGFVVEDISPSNVTLRGTSGQRFQIMPQAPVEIQPQSQDGPGGVIDLSQFPMAQF